MDRNRKLMEEISNISSSMRSLDSQDEFNVLLYKLVDIRSTAAGPVASAANKLLREMNKYTGLCIVKGGKISPISSHLAARHNILQGAYISGKTFLVMSTVEATNFLDNPIGYELPGNACIDEETLSVISMKCWFRRNPTMLLSISKSEADRIGLGELYEQQKVIAGD